MSNAGTIGFSPTSIRVSAASGIYCPNRHLDVEFVADPRGQTSRQQGVSAEFEEVGGDVDPRQLEHFSEKGRQSLFPRGARHSIRSQRRHRLLRHEPVRTRVGKVLSTRLLGHIDRSEYGGDSPLRQHIAQLRCTDEFARIRRRTGIGGDPVEKQTENGSVQLTADLNRQGREAK